MFTAHIRPFFTSVPPDINISMRERIKEGPSGPIFLYFYDEDFFFCPTILNLTDISTKLLLRWFIKRYRATAASGYGPEICKG